MSTSLAGRAETPMQARLLAHLRDDGPLSRVQLADRMNVSRTTIAAEVNRLGELGLAHEVGPAASRGGRRSTMVDLAPGIRFVGISIGATGMSVGVTDPNSAPVGPALTSNRRTVFWSVAAISFACSADRASWRARSSSIRLISATRPGVATSASRRGRR